MKTAEWERKGGGRRPGLDFMACHVEAIGYQEINIPKDQTCRIQETIISTAVNQWQGVNHSDRDVPRGINSGGTLFRVRRR